MPPLKSSLRTRSLTEALDPAQLGTGIQSLGTVRMHGAVKSTTFLRLAAEPLAGQTTLLFEDEPVGWAAGDEVVIPDTRQLRERERRQGFISRHEKLRIASVAGNQVTLQSALQYDHGGARTPDDTLEFLPHVGNLTRNIVVRFREPGGHARTHDLHGARQR